MYIYIYICVYIYIYTHLIYLVYVKLTHSKLVMTLLTFPLLFHMLLLETEITRLEHPYPVLKGVTFPGGRPPQDPQQVGLEASEIL